MEHLEAGEWFSTKVVETVLLLGSRLVRKVDQLDFLAVMMRFLGLPEVAVNGHLQSCLKGCHLILGNAHLWAWRRTRAKGEQGRLVWYHTSGLSSLA